MSGFQINLWCWPWDLVDEGVDHALDRLQGEAGLTGVSVAVHYHDVDHLRPHAGVSPRRFRSIGGAQFQPDAAAYAATRYRPVVADWVRKSNPLAAVAEACARRGLTLRAWLVGLHSPATVERFPAGAIKDLFGDLEPTWLCPSNLDVRELLRAMTADLTEHYPLEAVELEAVTFPPRPIPGFRRQAGFDSGSTGLWLRSLCFCESCRQMASRDRVDVAAAAAGVRRRLENLFASGEPLNTPVEDLLNDEPALAAYADWRCRQVTSLIELVRSSCRCRLVVHRGGDRWWAGADYAAIAAHCDALMPLYYEAAPAGLAAVVEQAAGEVDGPDRVEIGLSACTPPCPDSASLVALVREAARLGVRSVNIYQYGLLPEKRLEWIRQASRYAR
ncbi:MAG TPA: hypothetical protein VLM89_13865, partial [Phycisphaerae bacterium]|nr:hypothetical protein [Phycisphaerae bacterium]